MKPNIKVLSIVAINNNKEFGKLKSYLERHKSTIKQVLLDNGESVFCDDYDFILESEFNDDIDFYYFKKETMNKFNIKHFVSFQVKRSKPCVL